MIVYIPNENPQKGNKKWLHLVKCSKKSPRDLTQKFFPKNKGIRKHPEAMEMDFDPCQPYVTKDGQILWSFTTNSLDKNYI